MKKLLFLTIAAAFFFAACSDPDSPSKNGDNPGNGTDPAALTVPQVNTALVVKFSGTYCGPCGGWGWTAFSDIIAGTPNAVHTIAYSDNFVAHHFITPEATTLDRAQSISGYPTFSVNDIPRLARSGTVDVVKEKQMCLDATAAHEAAAVEMNAKIKYEIKDGMINISYKVKAFKDMPEDNYFAIYVLEDKVKQYQAGHPDKYDAIHKHVMRKGAFDEADDRAWGLNIGPMTNGQEISGKTSVKIGVDAFTSLEWAADNIEVIGVMRYEVGSVKMFINACDGERVN